MPREVGWYCHSCAQWGVCMQWVEHKTFTKILHAAGSDMKPDNLSFNGVLADCQAGLRG